MALKSEKLKNIGVKIKTNVCGVPGFGSGVVYVTPNYCKYNYVLTAKHLFQEDSITDYKIEKVSSIEILYNESGVLKELEYFKKTVLKDKLIAFDKDLAIIIISKNDNIFFQPIFVSDRLEDQDINFYSWATFSANQDQLHKFDFERNDPEIKRFKSLTKITPTALLGMSGGGIFVENKYVLHGIICHYPNDDFENNTIDCSPINFTEINKGLKSRNLIELDTHSSKHKKEIKNEIVDIHQVFINGTCLDLEKARKRLKNDLKDDWYHDPLYYIDLLHQDYLFSQFADHFYKNSYRSSEAELFYVPKKKLTSRQALISPLKDRIIYMATVGVLAEKLDNALIPNVFSARFNKFSENELIINGVEQWKKLKFKIADLANLKNKYKDYEFGCVIEIDLLNFYDNINKNLLNEKIIRICETKNEISAAKLLKKILKGISTKESGLPQNSDASSLLASFYLNQIDVFMSHIAPGYLRFMDDITIFCRDKYEARQILQTLEFELRRCHLSVNSQKTNIIELTEEKRKEFNDISDLKLLKIGVLRRAENYAHLNEAFHACIKIIESNLDHADLNSTSKAARELNYAFHTITFLGVKEISLFNQDSTLLELINRTIKNLVDYPWLTSQVCRILNILPENIINKDVLQPLEEVVLNDKYNTYSYQTYQLWLLFARHKFTTASLKQFAVQKIEKNDETNRPVIAALLIYMCSVDDNYRRVVVRKMGENFTKGYFQNRLTLISLRSFDSSIIDKKHIHPTLKYSFEMTNKFKDKDLVYVQGINENKENINSYFEQLYSL